MKDPLTRFLGTLDLALVDTMSFGMESGCAVIELMSLQPGTKSGIKIEGG